MYKTIISSVVLLLVLFAVGSIIIYTIRNGISPMPTSGKVKKELFNLLRKNEIQGNIVELGAGWGTLAFPLAKYYNHCTVLAFENSLIPYLFCRFLNLFFACDNLGIHRENIFNISLTDADVVVCYIHTDAMEKLKIKFEQELKEEAVVISSAFAVPYWKPCRQIEVNDIYRTKIYLYVKGRHSRQ